MPSRTWDLRLHLVTDERITFGQLVETITAAVAGGVTVVQYRNKTLSSAEIREEVTELSSRLIGRATLVVNDHLTDVCELRAAGVRVDGVHLGQSDASPQLARELLGPDALIGWTANTREHALAAAAFAAGTIDYLGVGVINSTATKADAPPVLGVSGFAEFTSWTQLPAVAIGGITVGDVAPLVRAGAAGIAVVSAICSSPNPREAARGFIGEFESVRAS